MGGGAAAFGPEERVANNPLFLDGMTPWPGNISWALLANRRSCFAGDQLLLAFAPLPTRATGGDRQAVHPRLRRRRHGRRCPRSLAARYDCALAVVTAQDGAWANDPFAASPLYELVESRRRRVADLPARSRRRAALDSGEPVEAAIRPVAARIDVGHLDAR